MLASSFFCVLTVEGCLRFFPGIGFRLADPSFFKPESGFRFHPELAYTLVPNTTETQAYRDDDCSTRSIEVRTNRFGLRGPDVVDDSHPRVLFIGDSFTEGYHVDEAETFAAVTGRLLEGRITTINSGIRNYDALRYMHMLRLARRQLHPDVVVVGVFVGNDVTNYSRSVYLPPMTSFALMRSIRTNSYLVSWIDRIAERNRGRPVTDQPGDGRHPMARSFYDLRTASECGSETLLDHADAYIRWRISPGKTRHYRDATSAFLHAQATAMVMADMQTELGDVPLHVLIIPERMQVKDDEWYWLTTHFPDLFVDRRGTVDRLERALADRGVASTSLIESLDESSYLRFDGHFSTQGHLRVAQHVARMLKQRHGDLLSGARIRRKP